MADNWLAKIAKNRNRNQTLQATSILKSWTLTGEQAY
jgi:hypothetical protein